MACIGGADLLRIALLSEELRPTSRSSSRPSLTSSSTWPPPRLLVSWSPSHSCCAPTRWSSEWLLPARPGRLWAHDLFRFLRGRRREMLTAIRSVRGPWRIFGTSHVATIFEWWRRRQRSFPKPPPPRSLSGRLPQEGPNKTAVRLAPNMQGKSARSLSPVGCCSMAPA